MFSLFISRIMRCFFVQSLFDEADLAKWQAYLDYLDNALSSAPAQEARTSAAKYFQPSKSFLIDVGARYSLPTVTTRRHAKRQSDTVHWKMYKYTRAFFLLLA